MLWWLLCAVLVAVDRFTKLWAISGLKGAAAQSFIPKVLQFSYVENHGIAFGMLQNKHWLIIPVNLVILAICVWLTRDFVKKDKKIPAFALCLIASGAVGNLSDKIFYGYVVDFIETVFMDFPVFNLADVFVCSGAAILIVYILFFDKKEEKNGNHL